MADSKELRVAYAEALVRLGEKDRNIMVVEADLMRANGTGLFAKAYPDRAVNVGVAEADLLGVAAGLSANGKIPFAATFGCFASRRAFDQFFISCNYARLNVKLVGTDPGVSAGFNGGTHMPFEDIVLMRAVPKLVICEPSDPVSTDGLTSLAAAHNGCVYMRLQRKPAPFLYKEGEKFETGKSKILREGKDVTIAALGPTMVNESLKAAELLKAEGIEVTVIDTLFVKPLDTDTILGSARKTGKLVTCENGQVAGGLSGAVAEACLAAGICPKFAAIGVHDEFGEVGTPDWLANRFGMTAAHIVNAVKSLK